MKVKNPRTCPPKLAIYCALISLILVCFAWVLLASGASVPVVQLALGLSAVSLLLFLTTRVFFTTSDTDSESKESFNCESYLEHSAKALGFGLLEIAPSTGKVRATAEAIALWRFDTDQESQPEKLKTWLAQVHEHDLESLRFKLKCVTRLESTEHLKLRLTGADGETRWIGLYAQLAPPSKEGFDILCVVHEVTDPMNAQEALLASAEEKNSVLQDFIEQQERQKRLFAIIGHELRTPISCLKMMSESNEPGIDSKIRETLGNSMDQLLLIMDDLRSIARPEQIVERASVVLTPAQVIEGALETLRASQGDTRIEINSHLDQLARERFSLNEQAIRQIIMHMVRTALSHKNVTQVDVELSVADPSPKGATFRLQVSDNGDSLSRREALRLFEPFYRENSNQGDTGVGLSTCRMLAQALGGDLIYLPVATGGSSFLCNFRLAAASETKASIRPPLFDLTSELPLSGFNVLLAEDNNMIRMLSEKILQSMGAQVTAHENGALALDAARDAEYDLVVTDIFMPEMDGYGLTEGLRKRGFKNPILGVTAATVGEESEKLLASGADFVMTKPFEKKKFLSALEQIS